MRDLKLNYSAILRTHRAQFSIGDLVALSRNFSSFKDINETLIDLLGGPRSTAAKVMAAITRKLRFTDKKLALSLERLFRIRHEIVHGSPRHLGFSDEVGSLVSNRDLLIFAECSIQYVKRFERLMRSVLRNYHERSTMDMIHNQGERLKKTDDRIGELEIAISKKLEPSDFADFTRAQRAWRLWRRREAEFQTHIWAGGTMRNVLRLGELTSMGTQRIRQLEYFLKENDKLV